MSESLQVIMRNEFAHAKWWYRASTFAQATIAATGLYSVFVKASSFGISLVAFVAPFASFVCKEVSGRYYSKGERVRRLHLLKDGLGIEPTEYDLLDIYANRANHKDSEPAPIGKYFHPAQVTGVSHLLLLLQQSSFWTANLARRTSYVHYGLAALGGSIAVTLAFLALRTAGGTATGAEVDYARLFSSLMTFFLTGSVMSSARSFQSLADATDKTFQRAADLRTKAPDMTTVYKTVGAYDAALAKALPIPSYVYKFYQDSLERSWNEVIAPNKSPSDQ